MPSSLSARLNHLHYALLSLCPFKGHLHYEGNLPGGARLAGGLHYALSLSLPV